MKRTEQLFAKSQRALEQWQCFGMLSRSKVYRRQAIQYCSLRRDIGILLFVQNSKAVKLYAFITLCNEFSFSSDSASSKSRRSENNGTVRDIRNIFWHFSGLAVCLNQSLNNIIKPYRFYLSILKCENFKLPSIQKSLRYDKRYFVPVFLGMLHKYFVSERIVRPFYSPP